MKKIALAILISAIVASSVFFTLINYVKPLLEDEIRKLAENNLGKEVTVGDIDIKFIQQKVVLSDLAAKEVKFMTQPTDFTSSRIEAYFDLAAILFNRDLKFKSIRFKSPSFLIVGKKSVKKTDGHETADKPEAEVYSEGKDNLSLPLARFSIGEITIEDMQIRYIDSDREGKPRVVELVGIDGNFEDLSFPINEKGDFRGRGNLEASLSGEEEGVVTLDGEFSEKEGMCNFGFDLKIKNADLVKFADYYEKTSFSILKDAKIDLYSDAQCKDNNLLAVQKVRIYDIELNDYKPSQEDSLFGLPAETVIDFFNKYKNDLNFTFNVTGTVNDPKFDPGPVIKQILSNALKAKILAKLQDLPREMLKISEKAVKDINVEEKMAEFDSEVEKIKKKLNEIMEY